MKEASDNYLNDLHETFKKRGLTLSVAESCTGGMIGQRITSRPGSSEFFEGGIVAYSNDLKERFLGVDSSILEQHGAVSEPVARQMARGVRERANTDYALSVTGVAGPSGGTPETPVGLVYVGLLGESVDRVEECHFSGSRREIRRSTTEFALQKIRKQAVR